MVRHVDTYVPAVVVDRRSGQFRPKMVVDNEYELSGTYVKWEVYENLRKEFWELTAKLSELSELRKTDE